MGSEDGQVGSLRHQFEERQGHCDGRHPEDSAANPFLKSGETAQRQVVFYFHWVSEGANETGTIWVNPAPTNSAVAFASQIPPRLVSFEMIIAG